MAWAANEPLKVEEIEVAPPQKGEVRVKVIANALVRITAWVGPGAWVDPGGDRAFLRHA